jgi:hypothetical protein
MPMMRLIHSHLSSKLIPAVSEIAPARSEAVWLVPIALQFCVRGRSEFGMVPNRSKALLPGSLPATTGETAKCEPWTQGAGGGI